MIFLIMGPQGSGKTTQADLLAEELHLKSVPVGQILRSLYEEKDELGIQAHKYWERGDLVPDNLMRQVIERYFEAHKSEQGFILDGFPRDLAQYAWMDDVFAQPASAVILVNISGDEITRRLNKRRRIENREDETPEAIENRLKHYRNNTIPLIKKLEDDGYPILEIDGERTPEQVHEEIMNKLKTYLDD